MRFSQGREPTAKIGARCAVPLRKGKNPQVKDRYFPADLSGTRHREIATTAAAIGRLRKKTARQEKCSINQPPRTGPIAVVIAEKPDQVPEGRGRVGHSGTVNSRG